MNFKDKVVYQIYPKSFKDSNGDGIGDIRGIIEKLDYLQDLGIDYIWSTPFFISPQRDNGYDVSDYYKVDPAFGTMADVEALILEADRRGMGLILDMVFNHTSTDHQWFKNALAGDKNYEDYYIFKGGNAHELPTNWTSKFGGPAWKYVEHLGKWYLHLFDETQADLNWENPRVREELKNVLKFWKKKGIKGFRFDVVNLISKPGVFEDDLEGDGRRFYTDGPYVHEFLQEMAKDADLTDMITVGEMSSTSIENCVGYSNSDNKELSMCFNFHHLKIDYKNGQKWELMKPDYGALNSLYEDWQLGMQEKNGWNAVFWCNHDQPRIVSRLGDDEKYWKESAKMLATAIHLLRGTPYIYQGEEIGMTNAHYHTISQYRDVESLNYYHILLAQGKSQKEALEILAARSRDNSRTPMQWDDHCNAGFTTGTPWITCPENYKTINVKNQLADRDSILAYYKTLIGLRKKNKAISEGEIVFIHTDHPQVFAYKRLHDHQEIAVFCNWKDSECTVTLEGNYRRLIGNYEDAPLDLKGTLALRPYECYVMER